MTRVLAAALGGVAYFVGYLGWGVWPCLLVFLAPLWWALEHTRAGETRSLALLGLVFGGAAYAGGFGWLWRLVGPFLDGDRAVGAALWAVYGAWFAAGFVAYAVLFDRIRRRGWPLLVAGVAPLVAIEWLQPQLFPVNAGSGLVLAPAWTIQVADLGGPLLLTALVASANVATLETAVWVRGRRLRPLAVWFATAAVTATVLGYGRVRIAALDAVTAPTLRVGVVQANLGLLEKRMQSAIAHRRHLEQTRELLAGGAVDLVVWPETAFVRGLRRPLPISGRPVVEDLTVPLLFGAPSVFEDAGRLVTTNSALLVDADGMVRDAYDKNLLIPLTEYVPLAAWVPAIAGAFPHLEKFRAAADTPALRLGAWRIATPICYEAIRADFVRAMVVRSKPHLLVTLANDAWFGDSAEPWMHLALARLRAVEHRRWLVRATNSGVSALVDPSGRVVARTGLLTRENLRGTVELRDGETLYARLGDWPGWLALALTVCGLGFRYGKSRVPRGSSVTSQAP